MLIYNPPIIPLQTELYAMLSDPEELSYKVYDSGVAADDILAQFNDYSNIKFGIIGDIVVTQDHSKTDTIIWCVNVKIELISTYRGRAVIAEMIRELGNCATRNEMQMSHNLDTEGYNIIRMNIDSANIGTASHEGGLNWQNGSLQLTYWLNQY